MNCGPRLRPISHKKKYKTTFSITIRSNKFCLIGISGSSARSCCQHFQALPDAHLPSAAAERLPPVGQICGQTSGWISDARSRQQRLPRSGRGVELPTSVSLGQLSEQRRVDSRLPQKFLHHHCVGRLDYLFFGVD